MKLKYYMCGLGSGIILAVLVLAIAGKISALGNSVNNNANINETTGSVIAYTTQADNKETTEVETQAGTEGNSERLTGESTGVTMAVTESETQSETGKVQVHIAAVTISSEIAKMLEERGVIDSAQGFIQYMYDEGYSRIVQEGDFEFTKNDTYANVARILTDSKNEASALISSWCDKLSSWSDDELSDTERWFKEAFRS